MKIPLNFGIRVIYCALKGKENIFYEQPADADFFKEDNGWRLYGGHRLWIAPESDKTYFPDNQRISYDKKESSVIVKQPLDEYLNIFKTIEIEFSEENPSSLIINHIIENHSSEVINVGLWTVSVMAEGSYVDIPFYGYDNGYAPGRNIAFWGNAGIADSHIEMTSERIKIRHQPSENDEVFKIGVWCKDGNAFCKSAGQKFEKWVEVFNDMIYPDKCVNIEIFQCRQMLEFEFLGPLQKIFPNGIASFTENWSLSKI